MEAQYREFAEKSLALVDSDEAAEAEERRRRSQLEAAASKIVQRLTRIANDTALKRKPIELRWINALCQYSGVRSVSEINTGTTKSDIEKGANGGTRGSNRSEVFVNITRPKTNRTEGRLSDILFPADDRNWGIQPTPAPELDTVAKRAMEEAERAVAEANRLASGGGEVTTPTGMSEADLIDKAQQLGVQGAEAAKILAEAKKRAERMGTEIDDQLVEARYAQKSRDALGWATKIGIGVLKGPVVMDGGRRSWVKGEEGYELRQSGERARPTVEHVSPWSFFPDPSATSIEDAEFIFERHLLSKSDLRKMARKVGFYDEPVGELITNGPGLTNGEDFQHLKDMRILTGDQADITGRYVVWEYHGPLETDEIVSLLRAMGTEEGNRRADEFESEADPLAEYRVIAHFCDGKLLKLAELYPMDSQEFIYSVFSLEKGPASILGAIGVPDKMHDSQEVLNAAWRMMMDNAKNSVGPQIVIDTARLRAADGDPTLYPNKVWLYDSLAQSGNGNPPLETFNIPMNQEQLAGIIALAKSFIDDETAMPSIIEGGVSEERAPGAASTVGGFAMLMNSAGIDPRRMVKNWDDDVTTGLIRRFYDWNMQQSEKDEIKGDMQVEARGTSVLLARELQAPHLLTAATQLTVHPVLGMAHKPYDIARLFYQSVNINPADVLVEREEYDQRVKAAAEQTAPEDPQWAVRKEIAMIDAEARRYESDASREVAILRLSEESKISIGDIAARLQEANLAHQSKERMLAAEIAVEQKNKAEAEAKGREPAGSGGFISSGSVAA